MCQVGSSRLGLRGWRRVAAAEPLFGVRRGIWTVGEGRAEQAALVCELGGGRSRRAVGVDASITARAVAREARMDVLMIGMIPGPSRR